MVYTVHRRYQYLVPVFAKVNLKAVGIVSNRGAPVAENAPNSNLLVQHIQVMENITILSNNLLDSLVVAVSVLVHQCNRTRTLQTPRNNLEAKLLGLLGVFARHNLTILCLDEVIHGWCDKFDSITGIVGQVGNSVRQRSGQVAVAVKIHGLLPKSGLLLQPVQNIVVKETLGINNLGADSSLLEGINHLLSKLLLGVVSLERHRDLRCLELRAVVETESSNEANVLLQGHDGSTRGVQIGAPVWCSMEEVLWRGGSGIKAIHLGAQRLEFLERNIAGAAFGGSGLAVLGRGERLGALGVQLRDGHNVGSGMQVTVAVTANKLPILGEGDIALQNASAHARTSQVGLLGVLGELKGSATTVAN